MLATDTMRFRPLLPYEPPWLLRQNLSPPRTRHEDQLELDLSLVPTHFPEVGVTPAISPLEIALTPKRIRDVITAILEIRAGHRAPAQLKQLLHPVLYERLCTDARTSDRYLLGRVHTCQPTPEAIEACGTVRNKDRTLAITARFEKTHKNWRCTVFTLLTPTPKKK